MSLFEAELLAKFRLDKQVKVPIDQRPDEEFVSSLERIGRQVMDIMQRHHLYDEGGADGDVISNVRFDETYGWVYFVRVQERN